MFAAHSCCCFLPHSRSSLSAHCAILELLSVENAPKKKSKCVSPPPALPQTPGRHLLLTEKQQPDQTSYQRMSSNSCEWNVERVTDWLWHHETNVRTRAPGHSNQQHICSIRDFPQTALCTRDDFDIQLWMQHSSIGSISRAVAFSLSSC